jgi:hypothetical protein
MGGDGKIRAFRPKHLNGAVRSDPKAESTDETGIYEAAI